MTSMESMESSERIQLTDRQLMTLSEELNRFMERLPPAQQSFLRQMFADAADAANADVSGYPSFDSMEDDAEVIGYAMMPASSPITQSLLDYAGGLERDAAEMVTFGFASRDE